MDDEVAGTIWASMDDGGAVRRMHELLHYIADRRTHEARWRAALEGCDLPSTFVWGDLDPVSGAHMIARVEERIPSAHVVRLADVGHWPLLEAPDEVAAAVVPGLLGLRPLRPQEAGAEEVEDLVQRGPGRLAGLVDEVLGDDRVRVLHRCVRVRRAVLELDAHEPVAELVAQVLEPFARHEASRP